MEWATIIIIIITKDEIVVIDRPEKLRKAFKTIQNERTIMEKIIYRKIYNIGEKYL